MSGRYASGYDTGYFTWNQFLSYSAEIQGKRYDEYTAAGLWDCRLSDVYLPADDELFRIQSGCYQFLECDPTKKTQRYELYQEVSNTIGALKYQNLIMESVTIYSESIQQSFGNETHPLEDLYKESWYRDGSGIRNGYLMKVH